jgi:ATP-binding cassette, subfamily B, heavy metal transporter
MAPHSAVEEGNSAPSFRPLWRLMPYLWPKGRPDLRARVIVSIVFLILATGFTSIYPLFLGWAVDRLKPTPANIAVGTVLSLISAYAISRILMQAFAQLRDGIFAKVQYHAMREVAVETFAHVHTLSLRFHLERKTGGLSRIIERGTRGIDTLLSFALFSIFPTILLLAVYTAMLLIELNIWVALTTLAMVAAYVWFTFWITRWRIQFRREMNQSDTDANTKAVDSLLNYETVKYFNNETHETRRYDVSMEKFSRASIRSPISIPARRQSWRWGWGS